MIFTPAPLAGVWIVETEPASDERGFFARTFDEREFERHGLVSKFPEHSIAYNARAGTIRGLHYQTGGDAEEKIVRCTSGAVHDVVLDLREASATFGKWFAIRLDAQNRKALYVPAGFAHGYQTLTDEAEVLYAISKPYAPQSARGIHHGDAALNIDWPLPLTAISARDAHLPPLAQAETFRL